MPAQPNNSGTSLPNTKPSSPEGVSATRQTVAPEPVIADSMPTLEQLVQDNRAITLDIQRRLKRLERLQLAKFIVTLVFVIAPLIGALIILPRAIGGLMTGYGVQGVDGQTGIMELWGQVNELQGNLDSVNAQTQ